MERFRRKTRSLLVSRKPRFMNFQMFAEGGGDPPPSKGGGYSAEYVQDLRNENASWRTKLREAESENEKLKTQLGEVNKKATDLEGQNKTFLESVCTVLGLDASKVKTEEVTAKIKEATSSSNVTVEKAQEALRKSAFIASAVKQGIRKEALEDAYKLADFSSVKVDLDSLVENLAKDKAYLLGKSGGVGGSSNPGGGDTPAADEYGKEAAKRQADQTKTVVDGQKHYFGG